MKSNSPGQQEVRKSAEAFAAMLPEIHPTAACREAIKTALGDKSSDLIHLRRAADASLSCLPAKFRRESFSDFFNASDTSGDFYSEAFKARNPEVLDKEVLGACKTSLWPRACSYWSSLHLMAYRADLLNKGTQFLHAVVPLLAGGSVLCEGCSLHFRLLFQPLLSDDIANGYKSGF